MAYVACQIERDSRPHPLSSTAAPQGFLATPARHQNLLGSLGTSAGESGRHSGSKIVQAGHLPPVLVRPDASTEVLDLPGSRWAWAPDRSRSPS